MGADGCCTSGIYFRGLHDYGRLIHERLFDSDRVILNENLPQPISATLSNCPEALPRALPNVYDTLSAHEILVRELNDHHWRENARKLG